MALLYGKIQDPPASEAAKLSAVLPTELPTEHELQPHERRALELDRLRHLLGQLPSLPEIADSGPLTGAPADDAAQRAYKGALTSLNLSILEALATTTRPEVELAYQLGRSLRDTVNPPLTDVNDPKSFAPALATQLARARISRLQEWLATLSTQFPQHAAPIVAASLGRWSELAAVTVSAPTRLRKRGTVDAVAGSMCQYLLHQGDLWLMLLTGERLASGLLSPEGYVAAGEASLRRTAAIVRRVLWHYAIPLLIVAAALGGIIYLAISSLGGAAKVWTSIAAIVGSLGVSAQTVASRTARLTAEAERPVFAGSEDDAMAWAITTMPAVSLTSVGVRQLRKAGITPTSSLGRI